MTLQRGMFVVAAAVVGFGCMEWVGNCATRGICSGGATEQSAPLLLAAAVPTLLIILALCSGRCAYLLWRTSRDLARLEIVAAPIKLKAAMDAAGISYVRCLPAVHSLAFCSGVLTPRIYVTTGLLDLLSGAELEAVLRHEEHHRQRRHPLLRSLLIAATEVMFFLPLMNWLAERILDDAELAADRAAIQQLGNQTVAAALWRVGTPTIPAPWQAIGFGGAVELRAAQLLGDTLPARRPAARLWPQSLIGTVVALEVGLCISGTALSFVR